MKRSPATLAVFFCALLCFARDARAQNAHAPIVVPQIDPGELGQPGFKFGAGVPANVNLISHGNGARTGHIWIGNTGQSIRIVGEVDGAAPDWPTDPNSILAKDHVEVWLAGPADVQMPPISWQTRMAEPILKEEDCKDAGPAPGSDGDPAQACRDWFETQQRDYRPLFKRLFLRQWLLADGFAVESYATPAYQTITQNYGENFAALKPTGAVRFRYEPRAGNAGYTFEIDIPYTALPPLNQTEVSELRLMVDVFSAARAGRKEGEFSTTTSERAYAKPETFNLLRLDPPAEFEISPCHPALQGVTVDWSPTYPAWFIPSKQTGEYQADAFLIEDWGWPAGANDSQSPSVTPEIHAFHYFWRTVGAEEWVCGPDLEYRNGDVIRDLGLNITSYDAGRDTDVTEDGFDARRAADGRVLIKVGPRVWNPGSASQCGACPRAELRIWALDENLNLITLFDFEGGLEGPGFDSRDMTVSPDLSRIVEYDQTGEDENNLTWSSVTYCLGKQSYAVCDHEKDVKPPEPPVIRQLLGQE